MNDIDFFFDDKLPVDEQATDETIALLRRLYQAAHCYGFLFGQQNAAHHGVTIDKKDGTESDIKRVCGKHPAVIGFDALSLTGAEGSYRETLEMVKEANREGAILTISMHMPNFATCDDAFSGYSPNVTDPAIVARILPDGDLHEKYLQYLNMVISFAKDATDDDGNPIPMIMRPFHEHNGNWFWWGKSHCAADDFQKIFRFTVSYFVESGVHSFLYAYSPNGPFTDEEAYEDRFPGNAYVDVVGFDMYHDRPHIGDGWMDTLRDSCRVVCSFAREHHKVAAVTECGIRMLDTCSDGVWREGLAPIDNPLPNWFMTCLDTITEDEVASEISFFLMWSNFNKDMFWTPYATDADDGHEMLEEFRAFLRDSRVGLCEKLQEDEEAMKSE